MKLNAFLYYGLLGLIFLSALHIFFNMILIRDLFMYIMIFIVGVIAFASSDSKSCLFHKWLGIKIFSGFLEEEKRWISIGIGLQCKKCGERKIKKIGSDFFYEYTPSPKGLQEQLNFINHKEI